MSDETLEAIDPSQKLMDAYSISANDFLKFLEAKGLDDMSCELCKSSTWAITSSGGDKPDLLGMPVIGVDPHGFIGKTTRPFYFCFCTGCGNTKSFYAEFVLGLLKPDSAHASQFNDRYDSSGTPLK
jgi:hypothetical protein